MTGGPPWDRDVAELGRGLIFEDLGNKHPAIEAFRTAFDQDTRFAGLRELMAVERKISGTEFTTTGSAYLVGDALPDAPLIRGQDLARGLVEAAWDRQRITGDPDPIQALDLLPGLLDELLRALDGERITVPACIGLRGLTLPEGLEVPIRGGTLRSPTRGEWRHGTSEDPVGLVLQLRWPCSISATLEPGEGRWQGWRAEPWTKLAERAEMVSLASSLASDSDYPPGVTLAWASVVGPINEQQVEFPPSGRPEEPVDLSADDAAALAAWTARVHKWGPRLSPVARHRAVMALHERTLYADGLVDAVIALEAMFGGGASLRVQAATAWLLAPDDYVKRKKVFATASEVYAARSAGVHSGAKIVGSQWVQATGLLRGVLRALLRDRPDLLDGGKIGDRVLLGEPSPKCERDPIAPREPQHPARGSSRLHRLAARARAALTRDRPSPT